MSIQARQKIVTVDLTIEEQDLLIFLLRENFYPSGSKKYKSEVNCFLQRFSRLVFNQDSVV